MRTFVFVFTLCLSGSWAYGGKEVERESYFEFDPAERTVDATLLDNPEFYDADIVSTPDGPWMTWLEFVPGQGDRLLCGRVSPDGDVTRTHVQSLAGAFARPTLTLDTHGRLWLSYEQADTDKWSLWCQEVREDGGLGDARRISAGLGPDINHVAAAGPDGSLWFAWQSHKEGQFDIVARRLVSDHESDVLTISAGNTWNDWQPAIAVTTAGAVIVAWDGYDGTSYNIYARTHRNARWEDTVGIAETASFEGRVDLATTPDNRVWIAWEQGAANWGKDYTSRMRLKSQFHLEIDDTSGPLHRFRLLRLAEFIPETGEIKWQASLPMPALKKARERAGSPQEEQMLGAYYEGARLAVDGSGSLWVIYRHMYVPWLGIELNTHEIDGWGLYARCLLDRGRDGGWSRLYRLQPGQGDGMQRLSVAPHGDGLALAWTTGRTDRRPSKAPRGLAWTTIAGDTEVAVKGNHAAPQVPTDPLPDAVGRKRPKKPEPAILGGRSYELCFGDLHRHTDLSLCFAVVDGTLEDAYRHAADACPLDFLAITDHSRDLALGNALSQIWWRCRKQVTRHDLGSTFIPMYAYERSRGAEDHNVISLRPDLLRPYTYPHPELWKELDDDTITIPHQTRTAEITDPADPPWSIQASTWDTQDNARRPLIEIYQGCRDRSIEHDARVGLDKHYLLGFIASSDHLATGGSYACVWTPERERVAIFRSMQARRTYGATAKIRLIVTCGDHWMGESFNASRDLPPIQVEAQGTAPIKLVELVVDGITREQRTPNAREIDLTFDPKLTDGGSHYLYVRLTQSDGKRAWSSPMFVKVVEATAAR